MAENAGRFGFLDMQDANIEETNAENGQFDLHELGKLGQEFIRQLQIMNGREKEVYRQCLSIADRLAYVMYVLGIREDIRLPMDYVVQFNAENAKQKIWPYELVKINMQDDKVVSAYVVNEPNTPYHDVVYRFDQDMKGGLIVKWLDFVNARIEKDHQMVIDFTEISTQVNSFTKMPPQYNRDKEPPKQG